MSVSRRRTLLWTILLVAGVPIVVILWTFMRELGDIGALDSQNPLEGVAATLLERVDQRIRTGGEMVELIAGGLSVSEKALGEAIGDYGEYVHSGPFLALAVDSPEGRLATYPATLSEGLGAGWVRPTGLGMSPLITLPGGALAVTMAASVTGESPGKVVGLFDASTVLGLNEVDRMQVAKTGEAFVVDGSGRVILSANRHLVGRSMDELGLAPAPTRRARATGHFTGTDGKPYLVGIADNPGWYQGPHQAWRVGLVAPEQAVLGRNLGMKRYLWGVIAAIMVITVGMVFVLRRSMGGRRA